MRWFSPALAAAAAVALTWGCSSIEKPCSSAGDVSWITEIRGDSQCKQKLMKDGSYLNHGRYIKRYPDGKIALEGDFYEGKKHGYWIQYDENGMKVVEKYFEYGVEKAPPAH